MDGGEHPAVAEVQELQEVSSRAPRLKPLQRHAVIAAALCLIVAAVTALADRGDDEHPVAAKAGDADPETTTTLGQIEATTTTASAGTTTTTLTTLTTTTEGVMEGLEPAPPVTSPPGPLRLTAPPTLDPYQWLTVESVDPCPPGTDLVQVMAWGVGGTTYGLAAGREQVLVGGDGHWSAELVIRAVGGIDNVDVAMTAPELEVSASCQKGFLWDPRNLSTGWYPPVRVDQRPVTVVPELTATWDGHTIAIDFSGCPTLALGGLHVGDAPLGPPSGEGRDLMGGVNDFATPGSEPGSWTHTIELPDYDPSSGLWAYGFCTVDSEFAAIIWRSLPFELDPPG